MIVRSARWHRRPTAKTIIKSAVLAAAKAVSTPRAELAIVLSDDSAVRTLNRQWRGKNAPTNVLSFPAPVRPPPLPKGRRGKASRQSGSRGERSPYIGDVVIAYQTTAREAAAEGKLFNHHLAHLAVHGFLHLLGYDHDNDRDAEAMERLERKILVRIGVADPYAARDAGA